MKRYQLLKVNSPLVELECGGTVIRPKQHIEDASINPNFPDAVVTAVVVCAQTICHCLIPIARYLGKKMGRMLGTYCSCMHKVPLVTCVLLCYNNDISYVCI